MYGSSPLTRGGHIRNRPIPRNRRLIPAYAGRTRMVCGMWRLGWAHPRLRGADSSRGATSLANWGSSPLTRGGRAIARFGQEIRGLIPAYAGRTRGRMLKTSQRRAHPRLRGADVQRHARGPANEGSSPLTRGGQFGTIHFFISYGLIPAYAGRTPPMGCNPPGQ